MRITLRDEFPELDPGTAVLIVNGRIFTADTEHPWANSILMRDGSIIAVGSAAEVAEHLEGGDEVVELDVEGRTVMPGIHDAHIHLGFSGLKFRYECRIDQRADGGGIVRDLTSCCSQHQQVLENEWVVGGEVNPFNLGAAGYDRAILDEAFPDRPVFLYEGVERSTPETGKRRLQRIVCKFEMVTAPAGAG